MKTHPRSIVMATRTKTPRLAIVKRADLDAYERRARSRETMRVVAAICLGSVVAGFMVAAIIALVSARMP